MSKEYTLYIKGIAILMMVYLHLFKFVDWDMNLFHVIEIADKPLLYHLSRFCNPVPIFLMLSGYGLYATYQKRGNTAPIKRVKNLYLHLWFIYLILLPIACYVRPDMYLGGNILIINAISYKCSYIGEQWFLLPYILLMVFSKYIFRLFDRYTQWTLIATTFIIYIITTFTLKFVGPTILGQYMFLYNPFLSFHMLFAFTLGYLAKKNEWMEKFGVVLKKMRLNRNTTVLMAIVLVCTFAVIAAHGSFDVLIAFALVMLFAQLSYGKVSAAIVSYLGRHSMNIWLIHTWFCYRLFHDEIYGLHYPLAIYIVVLAISLIISHIVEWLYAKLIQIVPQLK